MRRDRARIDRVEPAEAAQQRVGEDWKRHAEQYAGAKRGGDVDADTGLGDIDPALEADRRHQIQRHALGDRLGNRQVGTRKASGNAEQEEQDNGRQQGRERCVHGRSVGSNGRQRNDRFRTRAAMIVVRRLRLDFSRGIAN
jgi:hypothetical protein